MSNSELTAEDLRRRPEGQLRFPGAEEIWSDGFDAGTPHGFDGLDRSAEVQVWFRTDAEADEVLAWHEAALTGLGWRPMRPPPDSRAFHKDHDTVLVVIAQQRAGMWAPPGAYDRPGTVFWVSYSVPPTLPPPEARAATKGPA